MNMLIFTDACRGQPASALPAALEFLRSGGDWAAYLEASKGKSEVDLPAIMAWILLDGGSAAVAPAAPVPAFQGGQHPHAPALQGGQHFHAPSRGRGGWGSGHMGGGGGGSGAQRGGPASGQGADARYGHGGYPVQGIRHTGYVHDGVFVETDAGGFELQSGAGDVEAGVRDAPREGLGVAGASGVAAVHGPLTYSEVVADPVLTVAAAADLGGFKSEPVAAVPGCCRG